MPPMVSRGYPAGARSRPPPCSDDTATSKRSPRLPGTGASTSAAPRGWPRRWSAIASARCSSGRSRRSAATSYCSTTSTSCDGTVGSTRFRSSLVTLPPVLERSVPHSRTRRITAVQLAEHAGHHDRHEERSPSRGESIARVVQIEYADANDEHVADRDVEPTPKYVYG